ncbi:MAG TPA: riboflavin synthase [Methylophilaceae bacterium]|nr:riboflavin synthase [Methylophilaceae bacterium]
MFTGIIQTIGYIENVLPQGEDVRLTIEAASLGLEDIAVGDSIAVNGICLTVTDLDATHFFVHVSKATLEVTVGLDSPKHVNLEKALRLSDRLGGHLVSGHVDGIGQVCRFEPIGDCWLLAIRAPHPLAKYIAQKGSICVDGVSLTVNAIEHDIFSINIIPHTIQNTIIQHLGIGSRVNLEIDLIARYVERMTEWSNNNNESA